MASELKLRIIKLNSVLFKSILIAGFGGFVGTALRFVTSRYFQLNFSSVFPWGTFVVNIIGCFIIGIIWGIAEESNLMSTEWRLFFTVGLCGGFTTFSSFSVDALTLLQNKELLRFTFYTGLSIFLGLLTTIIGRGAIGKLVVVFK